jgi:AraC-like DNA-binding protein
VVRDIIRNLRENEDSYYGCPFFMEKTMDLKDLYTDDIEFLIDQCIHNEVHRKILKRRLLDHVKYENLAEEFNYSPRHIKRIVYKSQDILYSHIESADLSVGFSFAPREVLIHG